MKRLVCAVVFVSILVLALPSCNLFPKSSADGNSDKKETDQPLNNSDKIVLGDKIYNPFSINNLMDRGVDVNDENANWYYFRVRSTFDNPAEDESLKFLKDTFGFLETVPIDYEIVTGGYYYDDPEIDEDNECPWIYFMRPVDEYELIINSGYDFKIEVLDKMYVEPGLLEALEKEDANDEELSRFVTISTLRGTADDDPARWFGGTWGSPKGYVYFDDYDGSLDSRGNFIKRSKQPLYGITVASSQLILTNTTTTNKNGYYSINRSYGSWFGKVRIRLIFSNNRYEFNGLGKWWEYVCDAYEYVGTVHTSDVSSYNINLNDSSYRRANRLANLHDAVGDYYDFCQEMGVNPPTRCLRIWLNNGGNGSACTLYAREGLISDLWTTLGAFGFFGGPITGIWTMIVMKILSNWFPDIVMTGFDNDSLYMDQRQIQTLWHELSHASHFGASGTSYLTKEYFEMIGSIPDYPEDSDLVDVIESWGYFAENYIYQWQKNKIRSINTNSNSIDLPDFCSKRRGYSYSFAEILKYHPNIKVSDIFKALINTSSIDDFVSKLSKNKRLSKNEASIIKSYFSERISLQ